MKGVEERGAKFIADVDMLLTESMDRVVANPQTLWKACKEDFVRIAKNKVKKSYHKLNSYVQAIERDLQRSLANPDLNMNENTQMNAAFLINELEYLEKVKAKNQRDKMWVNLAIHGECLGGQWSALCKERKPRNLILRLKIPNSNPTQYERCTKRMAKLARNHHEGIQNDNTNQSPEEQMRAIDEALRAIPESQLLPEPKHSALNWKATEDHI